MLSEKLKTLRTTQTKLTQADFAKKIDVARTTYAMYEQGHREPDYKTLQRIADFHGVSTDYLLGRETVNKNESANIESNLNDEQTNLMFDGWLEMDEEQRKEALDFMEYLKSKKNRER